jgi:hypothetical protein
MKKQSRANRPIRMSDAEWDYFKRRMGAEWLRLQIQQGIWEESRNAKAEKVS